MTPPRLTRSRWRFMITIKRHLGFQTRAFLSSELASQVKVDFKRKATCNPGASMYSLEKAGWLQRVHFSKTTESAFYMGLNTHAWELTEEGRRVLDLIPEKEPPRSA